MVSASLVVADVEHSSVSPRVAGVLCKFRYLGHSCNLVSLKLVRYLSEERLGAEC